MWPGMPLGDVSKKIDFLLQFCSRLIPIFVSSLLPVSNGASSRPKMINDGDKECLNASMLSAAGFCMETPSRFCVNITCMRTYSRSSICLSQSQPTVQPTSSRFQKTNVFHLLYTDGSVTRQGNREALRTSLYLSCILVPTMDS